MIQSFVYRERHPTLLVSTAAFNVKRDGTSDSWRGVMVRAMIGRYEQGPSQINYRSRRINPDSTRCTDSEVTAKDLAACGVATEARRSKPKYSSRYRGGSNQGLAGSTWIHIVMEDHRVDWNAR